MNNDIPRFVFAFNASDQTYNNFTLEDLDKNEVTLDYLVKLGPVMIYFWATCCRSCKEEMKKIQQIYEK